jgi:hypothetical protein
MPDLFPEEFADLEAVGRPWSIGSDRKRYRTHLRSSIEDMHVFYDAVLPRAHEILAYCDRFDMINPPRKVRALMNMLYSLIVVSFPVEAWKAPAGSFPSMENSNELDSLSCGAVGDRRRG